MFFLVVCLSDTQFAMPRKPGPGAVLRNPVASISSSIGSESGFPSADSLQSGVWTTLGISLFTLSGRLLMMPLTNTGSAGGVAGTNVHGLSKENFLD